jgi:Ca2+-binding EF-hand superfamily protein
MNKILHKLTNKTLDEIENLFEIFDHDDKGIIDSDDLYIMMVTELNIGSPDKWNPVHQLSSDVSNKSVNIDVDKFIELINNNIQRDPASLKRAINDSFNIFVKGSKKSDSNRHITKNDITKNDIIKNHHLPEIIKSDIIESSKMETRHCVHYQEYEKYVLNRLSEYSVDSLTGTKYTLLSIFLLHVFTTEFKQKSDYTLTAIISNIFSLCVFYKFCILMF